MYLDREKSDERSVRTHAALSAGAGHKVDAATGRVVTLTFDKDPGDDAAYAAGDAVKVRLTFDEAVDVDTEDGTPR